MLLAAVLFLLGLAHIASAQDNSKKEKADRIKVKVEEVRVDAVVLDKKGHSIPDLTAEDFLLYQDGKQQEINAITYVDDTRDRNQGASVQAKSKEEPLVSAPKLLREEVRRTVVFLVQRGVTGSDPRPYIRKFVESQMRPGDLVGIISIGAGPPIFSSDKRELLLRMDEIGRQFAGITVHGCGGPAAFSISDAIMSGASSSSIFDGIMDVRPVEEIIRGFKADIAPIRYAIRALQDMPGRKHLILTWEHVFCQARRLAAAQDRLLNEMADEAWRANVVISMWDFFNTQQGSPYARFNILYRKTGGVYTDNQNFLYKGKPALDTLGGYYLLSYIPPENTFDAGHKDKYHKIRIYMKRRGMKVNYRDGFYRSPGEPSNFAVASKTDAMLQAIFSPFQYNDLQLNVSSGYAFTPASGYFLRSWMHLEGKNLRFSDGNNGEQLLSLELQVLASDTNGHIQDARGFQYRFRLHEKEALRVRSKGIDLQSYLPVRNSGNYYISAAIRDLASGYIGSGYQFIDIPDLSRRRLSLASIFMLTNETDDSMLRSGHIQDGGFSVNEKHQWLILPQSPALRTYKPGERVSYRTVIYNAENQYARAPKLELRSVLYKDGAVFRQQAEDISLEGKDASGGIPIEKTLILDDTMGEGDYVLQLIVADKMPVRHPRAAVQAIDIKIRK